MLETEAREKNCPYYFHPDQSNTHCITKACMFWKWDQVRGSARESPIFGSTIKVRPSTTEGYCVKVGR